jgi:hypothetical protein
MASESCKEEKTKAMSSAFESAGVALLAPSGKSLRLEINDRTRVFTDIYYLSLHDIENVVKKHKSTAQIVKLKGQEE